MGSSRAFTIPPILGPFNTMLPKRIKPKLAAELGRFVQQYARKAHKHWDPNDRNYDRKLEEKMKRLSPEDLSDLLSGEDIEPVVTPLKPKDS
jgi:hypothetical protein